MWGMFSFWPHLDVSSGFQVVAIFVVDAWVVILVGFRLERFSGVIWGPFGHWGQNSLHGVCPGRAVSVADLCGMFCWIVFGAALPGRRSRLAVVHPWGVAGWLGVAALSGLGRLAPGVLDSVRFLSLPVGHAGHWRPDLCRSDHWTCSCGMVPGSEGMVGVCRVGWSEMVWRLL